MLSVKENNSLSDTSLQDECWEVEQAMSVKVSPSHVYYYLKGTFTNQLWGPLPA